MNSRKLLPHLVVALSPLLALPLIGQTQDHGKVLFPDDEKCQWLVNDRGTFTDNRNGKTHPYETMFKRDGKLQHSNE
ncbi:MAG: hypothetical protein AAFV95_01940 [Bacteroidota bacterium]